MIKLVVYTAKWCPPCKVIKPLVKALCEEHPDMQYEEIDVDKKANQPRCDEDRVLAIPTMIMYANDKKVWRVAGTVGAKALANAYAKAAKEIATP